MTGIRALSIAGPLLLAATVLASNAPSPSPKATAPTEPCGGQTTAVQAKADLKAVYRNKRVEGGKTRWTYLVSNEGCTTAAIVEIKKRHATRDARGQTSYHDSQEVMGTLKHRESQQTVVICSPPDGHTCFGSSIKAVTKTPEHSTANNYASAP